MDTAMWQEKTVQPDQRPNPLTHVGQRVRCKPAGELHSPFLPVEALHVIRQDDAIDSAIGHDRDSAG